MGGEGDLDSLDIRSELLFIEEKVDVLGVLILLLSLGGCQFSIFSFSNSDFLFLVLTFGFSKISSRVVVSSIFFKYHCVEIENFPATKLDSFVFSAL